MSDFLEFRLLKNLRHVCGGCYLPWRAYLCGIRMMSGCFQDAIPGLFDALFGAGVLGWGPKFLSNLSLPLHHEKGNYCPTATPPSES